ncbi:MAG: DUF4401 domain-containing protein [Pseudomonadota bacterium]
MSGASNTVWERLERAGMVSGEAPILPEPESPWFVKLLLAVSGWAASLFLLVGIVIVFGNVFDQPAVALTTGLILVALAIIALRTLQNDFFEHSALALSLAGQGLMSIGVYEIMGDFDAPFFWLFAAFQLGLCFVVPSFVHRVWSACIAVLCVFFALQRPELHHLVGGTVMFGVASVWLNEYLFPRHVARNTAIAYGATLAVGLVALFPLLGVRIDDVRAAVGVGPADAEWYELPMVGKALVFFALLYTVWGIMRRYSLNMRQQRWVVLAAIALGALSFNVSGITIGVILLLLGFAASNTVLSGIGFVVLLGFFGIYYYQLEQTLLVKSGIFVALGVSLLLIRWVLPGKSETTSESGL